ncbi:MAG: rod shape-determining protein MreC [Patescibacteria group bacterium]|nr:rod shape-determining protein MreC [Patescibacteria group bacterium]
MTFLSRKNKKFLFVVILLIVVVFVSSRGADNPVKGVLLTIASPFLKTFRIFSGGVAGLFDFLGSIGNLKNENEKLTKENQKLLSENTRLKEIEKENEILREETKLAPKEKFDLEASFIIAQDPEGQGNRYLIDKGKNSGIGENMPVIVSSGILVGKVSEVFPNASRISLITDQNSVVNAEITDSGVKGIAKGTFGLGLMLDMISQADVINEGDKVITSGLGKEMPRGLLVGKIGQISQSPDRLFQQTTIISPVDFSDLRIVFVVKKW